MKYVKALFRIFGISPSFTYGLIAFALLRILGFVVDGFTPFDPTRWRVVPRDQSPSLTYFFGTNTTGQDVFWLTTRAIKNSFTLAALAGAFSLVFALTMGFLDGWKRWNGNALVSITWHGSQNYAITEETCIRI